MIFVFVGILILLVSFVIALFSLIHEQKGKGPGISEKEELLGQEEMSIPVNKLDATNMRLPVQIQTQIQTQVQAQPQAQKEPFPWERDDSRSQNEQISKPGLLSSGPGPQTKLHGEINLRKLAGKF